MELKVDAESSNMAVLKDLMVPEHNQLFSGGAVPALSHVATPPTAATSLASEQVSSPATPGQSPENTSARNGKGEEAKEKDKGKGEKGEKGNKRLKLEAVTALEKGRDLEKQILAKKSECMTLMTQVRTLEFGAGLAKELEKHGEQFEPLGNLHSHESFKKDCPPNQASK